MYLLRRTAVRALATPSKFLVHPRSFTTVTPVSSRIKQQQWATRIFQRRYISDDVTKASPDTAEAAAAEAEDFAQTAAEAPVEENLTPAQESAQASPTDKAATAGVDSLEAAAFGSSENITRRSHLNPAPPSKTVYVGNLFYEVTEEQLKRVFSRFGTVEKVRMVYDNRGLSRGFAYVEYQSTEEATVAIQNLDMQIFEGRNLVVQFHRARKMPLRSNSGESTEPSAPSRTLFIGNMSFEMSDKDLNELFRDIRNVMDVRVAIDRRTGQPRGFAHADFIDIASAVRAKEVLGDKTIYGRKLRIDFTKNNSRQQQERPRPSEENK